MATLTGTADIDYDGTKRNVLLTLDFDHGCLIAQHPQEGDPISFLMTQDANRPGKPVTITNVVINSAIGPLTSPRLNGFYVSRSHFGSWSPQVTPVVNSFFLGIDASHVTRIELQSNDNLIELNFRPGCWPDNEIVFTPTTDFQTAFTFHLHDQEFNVSATEVGVGISSKDPIDQHCTALQMALTLLTGNRVFLFSSCANGQCRINLTREPAKRNGAALWQSVNDAPDLFETLFTFISGLPSDDFSRWQKATALIVAAKSADSPLDLRIINAFVLIEMFDDQPTLGRDKVARMLDIDVSDADLIIKVRNKLLHQHHSLSEAIEEADRELSKVKPSYRLKAFDLSETHLPESVLFTFRVWERINAFIARKIGWSRQYNNYPTILRHKGSNALT